MPQSYVYKQLSAAERPKALYRYNVSGFGAFPTDMLRYDCAWPEGDASQIDRPNHVAEARGGTRTVELRSFYPPTVARWLSFGWEVSERVK